MAQRSGASYQLPIMSNVLLSQYRVISDCLIGTKAIKDAQTKYLPVPNAADTSAENKARYAAYIDRAIFWNATKRTHAGLVGQVFAKEPVYELPTGLEHLETDTNGQNLTLSQFSRKALNFNVAYARAGLLVDFPDTGENGASREQIDKGIAVPVLRCFDPSSVINWRTVNVGSKEYLTLVVVEEMNIIDDDGFEFKEEMNWREMRLINGQYWVRIWEGDQGNPTIKIDWFQPKGADGQPLDEIPFFFIGAENNDVNPDNPTMYDLANMNIGHYRNSADYEESVFVVGQPTVAVMGLTQDWWTKVMKERITIGARGGLSLPVGADAKLLQVEPNSLAREAMIDKQEQMVALGAQIIAPQKAGQTATEDNNEESASRSILAMTTKNTASGIEDALRRACVFTGDNPDDVVFKLNQDFEINSLSTEERGALLREWQAGAISWAEYRGHLQGAGIADGDLDPDDAKELIAEETADMMDLDEEPGNQGV